MNPKLKIDAAKINRPFQFFATVIICATVALYFYMHFATKIQTPWWASNLFVIFAVSFYPLLIGICLFLLINYRAELQEDSFYTELIREQLKEAEIRKKSISKDSIITETDTKKLLESIPEIDKNEIDSRFVEAHKWLLANGIYTKQDLNKFSLAKQVIRQLAELYTEELLRSEKHPLDPIGLAMYGSVLYKSGLNLQVINVIRRTLQNSTEYKQKHAQ